MLVERAAEPLHHAAPHLLVDQQRVDDPAAILDHPMVEQLDDPGLHVDLEPAGLDAVGEGEGELLGDEMARLHEFARRVLRQCVATEIDEAAELRERHARLAGRTVDDLAHRDIERSGVGWRIEAATATSCSRRAKADCSAASPPMPAPRQAQVPPP